MQSKNKENVETLHRKGFDAKQISELLGIHLATVYRQINKINDEKQDDIINVIEDVGNKPLTVDEIVEKFNVDMQIWELDSITTNSWDVTNKDGTTITNYQTKARFVRRDKFIDFEKLIEQFKEKATNHTPPKSYFTKLSKQRKSDSEYILELPIFDLHLGRYAWHKSCGENYDFDIASKMLVDSLEDLMQKTSHMNFDKILLVLGGDILNCDNMQHSTSSGAHAQDMDGRIHRVFSKSIDLFVNIIDKLLALAPVDIVAVSGNHDAILSYTLYEALRVWYRNTEDVSIDSSPVTRKYYQYGQNLFGITHGNMSAKAIRELPMIMAAEAKEYWSKCKYREYQYGHLHSIKDINYVVAEDNFCLTRRMPSLAKPDQWSFDNGFVGSETRQNALVYHKEQGLTGMFSAQT